jgi:cellobiose epimerase
MRKEICLVSFALIAGSLLAQETEQRRTHDQSKELNQLKTEVKAELTGNILPFWSGKMLDNENGGFYGRIDGNDKLQKDANKGGILNARILWTFSSAFRVLHDSAYLVTARRARDYILDHFIDKDFGGAYLSLNARGEPLDTRKQVYTQAFFIYALAEYNRATGDKEALLAAKKIFEKVEEFGYDQESGGYFEVYSRNWKRTHDKLIGEKSRHDQKGMNTHLHILEAYTNLYRVWPDKRVEICLTKLVNLFLKKIVNPKTFHLNFFMNAKWEPTAFIDSYGHDIEASWLLPEAADLLKNQECVAQTRDLSLKMVKAACEGLQPDGSFIYEKNNNSGIIDYKREWWVQAEALTGFLNAFKLSGDELYLEKAGNTWNYIDKHIIDHINGEWYYDVDENGKHSGDKAGPWKCPYHSSRMCMEIIEKY